MTCVELAQVRGVPVSLTERARRSSVIVATAALFTVALSASTALGFQEPNDFPGGPADCMDCHFDYQDYIDDCNACHADADPSSTTDVNGFEFYHPSGPHTGYSATSKKCGVCHSVHEASGDSSKLLPSATIVGTCFSCHDGTGGWGVYGTIVARMPTATPSGHSVDTTSLVPGGDPISGDSSVGTFLGSDGALICTDCHSPHGTDLVNPFLGDRVRMRQSVPTYTSRKLLKRLPTGATTPVDDYGSDWCLACHAGRGSTLTAVHNHPVDSSLSTTLTAPFTYSNIARLASHDATSVTEWGSLGGLPTSPNSHAGYDPLDGAGNRGFLMPYPRTTGVGGQVGHAPICQQCHEDSRSVGELTGDGSVGDAATASVAWADSVEWNGSAWVTGTADNPRFQNFPHETENALMLVEVNDNLCLNCHPSGQLP